MESANWSAYEREFKNTDIQNINKSIIYIVHRFMLSISMQFSIYLFIMIRDRSIIN